MNETLPVFSDPSLARYSHDAMKTTFRIFVSGGDRSRVDSAVSEASRAASGRAITTG